MTHKRSQFHKNVFSCDSGTKRLKTSEKWPKFTQITFSVPEVTQNGKTSPLMFKMNKKSTLVLGKSKIFTNDPWMKVYTN